MSFTSLLTRLLLASSLLLVSACQLISQLPTKPLEEPEVCQCPTITPPPARCPTIKPAIKKPEPCNPVFIDDLLLIGRVENVFVLPQKLKMKARIDTGAGITSMHAVNITDFERDGKPWVKFIIPVSEQESVPVELPVKRYVAIKQLTNTPQRRPVVAISIKLGSLEERVDVTLTDRSEYLYRLLIGRNFLRHRAIVDVSKKFMMKQP